MINNVKNWFKSLSKSDILWGIGGIVFLVLVISFYAGVNFRDVFLLGKKGVLRIETPLSQTSIYIDEEKTLVTQKENENLELLLSPRKHSVIISHEGYYPWAKEVTVPRNNKINIAPIFVPINTTGQIVTKEDPEYQTLRRTILENVLPTKETPLISTDKQAKLWMDDNAILVSVASTTYKVIQPDTIIRSVSFYRDRSDVVIFSTSNAVYAIEISKEGKQNFMPIYKGVSPSFIKTDPSFIYIWDNETLMQVVI